MSAPLGILLRSAGHEPAHYALMLATGAAAIGRPVILFATNAGCRLLLRRTPLLADEREAVLARRNVVGIAPLLDAAQDLGVRRLVCEAGLRAEGLDAADLAPGVEVTGVVTFLGAVGAGQMLSL
ncbi:DsrE family protein [Pseudoroseomonas cervicalis]|uniref:DsrE family protein n=1 Tax=Teichococcus cervicalis TaxID=204525 RepID=UPI0022F1A814|nr:DsrE family protein [Pseudoroseomonas cervicalis]WBV43013.1 DsrE family protein [Pseudoroseomonas cervicalis]